MAGFSVLLGGDRVMICLTEALAEVGLRNTLCLGNEVVFWT